MYESHYNYFNVGCRSRAQVYRPGVHEEAGHEGQHHPHHRQGGYYLQD